MAQSSTIRVMISSRCNDKFPQGKGGKALSDIRKELKNDIESEKLLGQSLFDVWINEDAPPKGGSWDSWDTCLEAVKDCDVLLVLSNGHAGWSKESGDIGICHAELATGLSTAPGKVYLISLGNIKITKNVEGNRNKRFQEYIQLQSLFRGGEVKTIEALKERVNETLAEAVINLTQRGVREASKGKFHSGQALDWNRLDFTHRNEEMIRVLKQSILQRIGSKEDKGKIVISIANKELLMVPHAIPAAMSVGPAKEMVGQPFLRDHELASFLSKSRGGPFHIIACHKTATEAQASKFLGFPDATIVSAPFGIYVADNLQKVQFAFIANCRDESTTRHGVQRFFEWLEQTGEDRLLSERAQKRARIVKAISKEMG